MRLACVDAIAPGVTLRDKFENLERYGFEGIEIWTDGGNLEQKEREIAGIASRSKVKPSSVIVVDESFYRPLDCQEAKKAKSEAIKASLRLGAALSAVSLVVPEYGPQLPPPILTPPPPGEAEKTLLLELLEEIARYAEDVGATPVLEPLNRYETRFFHTLDDAIGICREVGSPNLKIMADFFQMTIEEGDIAASIERAGEYIHHVHLADSNRLLPGYGHFDFKAAFAALKKTGYEGYMALECAILGRAEEELPRCADYLRECMPA
jgi:sugar phosphate isomerase/epimerase